MTFESLLVRTILLFIASIIANRAKRWFHTYTLARATVGTIESHAIYGAIFAAIATAVAYLGFRIVLPTGFLWAGLLGFALAYFFPTRIVVLEIVRVGVGLIYAPIYAVGYATLAATNLFNLDLSIALVLFASFAINFASKYYRNTTYYVTYEVLAELTRP